MPKKTSFWIVLWVIIKISFISFGGGNAVFPVLKRDVVEKRNWIDEHEFNELIIKTNLLPGPSIVQSFTYISIRMLGFWRGMIVTLIGTLPHVLFFFGIFLGISYLPQRYLLVVSAAVLPTVAGIVLAFTIDFIKKNKGSVHAATFWIIFIFTLAYSLFVPAPFNAPIFPMLVIIVYVTILFIVTSKKTKVKTNVQEQEGEENA
ncbi:chromate transporter [Mycoplasmopsis californica]|uniref:Chromate transporter n=1 Tax=Mycoplasmopsis equigenitalium TaxID=114883 RepID=A0ABY5J2I3_9BACT|nr:chromate transporter [Mycoplasmopsis equigenitalium]UUD36978.1 chromate transporter [Mycoplasmopsis equigenitalium]VEU69726.1 chromate transporter [Mycoplasmopsis californica]